MRSERVAWALAAIVCCAHGGEGEEQQEPVRRFQIEVLYTIHARLDTDEKLDRIRALVLKAYPDAKFGEVGIADQKVYFGTFRNRLLRMAGAAVPAGPWPEDAALREKLLDEGFAVVKAQVNREVTLRSIYEFLHEQARDDVSLKEIFEKLKAKDDPKDPVCSTEPGKGLVVYRDFGGKPLSGDELTEIEDGGVKFGFGFRPRVTGLGDTDLPKMSRKADGLGAEWEGRQIFRLVAVKK